MIAAIRISGQVGLTEKIKEGLFRLHLRKKYTLVLLKSSNENIKKIVSLRNFIAYGDIDAETLKLLIKNRAQLIDKDAKHSDIINNIGKKSFKDLGIKPFFRLHPPRKGIDSKKHFGVRKGVLGDNKDSINDLIRRML